MILYRKDGGFIFHIYPFGVLFRVSIKGELDDFFLIKFRRLLNGLDF